MRTIGIRELKTHLSRTLRDVERGEHYLVTDRGRVVAELRQPGLAGGPAATVGEDAGRWRLAAEGALRVAEHPRRPLPHSGVSLPEGTAQTLLDWVRGDR